MKAQQKSLHITQEALLKKVAILEAALFEKDAVISKLNKDLNEKAGVISEKEQVISVKESVLTENEVVISDQQPDQRCLQEYRRISRNGNRRYCDLNKSCLPIAKPCRNRVYL